MSKKLQSEQDLQFEAFLNASDESLDPFLTPGNKNVSRGPTRGGELSWWKGRNNYSDNEEESEKSHQPVGSGKSFLRKKDPIPSPVVSAPMKNGTKAKKPLSSSSESSIDERSSSSSPPHGNQAMKASRTAASSFLDDAVTSFDTRHYSRPQGFGDSLNMDGSAVEETTVAGAAGLTHVTSTSFDGDGYTAVTRTEGVGWGDSRASEVAGDLQTAVSSEHDDGINENLSAINEIKKAGPTMLSKVSLMSSMDDTTTQLPTDLKMKAQNKTLDYQLTAMDTGEELSAMRSAVANELRFNQTASLWQPSDMTSIRPLDDRGQASKTYLGTTTGTADVPTVTITQSFGLRPLRPTDEDDNFAKMGATLTTIPGTEGAVSMDTTSAMLDATSVGETTTVTPTPTPRNKRLSDPSIGVSPAVKAQPAPSRQVVQKKKNRPTNAPTDNQKQSHFHAFHGKYDYDADMLLKESDNMNDTDHTEAYEVKPRPKSSTLSHANQKDRYRSGSGTIQSHQSRGLTVDDKRETETKEVLQANKKRYGHVRSSGYGRPTSATDAHSQRTDMSLSVNKKDSTQKQSFMEPPMGGTKVTQLLRSRSAERQRTTNTLTDRPALTSTYTRERPSEELLHAIAHHQNVRIAPRRQSPLRQNTEPHRPDHQYTEDLLRESILRVRESLEWQRQLQDEKQEASKVKADLLLQERHFSNKLEDLKKDYERRIALLHNEISDLQSRNMIEKPSFSTSSLLSKLLSENSSHGVSKDKIEEIVHQLQEQETILSGYQKENERLYSEIKKLQISSKEREKRLLEENHRLQQECMSLKMDVEQKELERRNLAVLSRPNQPTKDIQPRQPASHIAGDSQGLRHEFDELKRQYRELQLAKHQIEATVDKVRAEKIQLQRQFETEKDTNSIEMEKLRERHNDEVADLKKKLRWYVDNQALIQRDSQKLKMKEKEISELYRQLTNAPVIGGGKGDMSEVNKTHLDQSGKKFVDFNNKDKAKLALESYLETKIISLEKELTERQSDSDRALRSLQQQYYSMKEKYEEHIGSLEHDLQQALSTTSVGGGSAPSGPTSGSTGYADQIRKELELCRKDLRDRDEEIKKLKQDLQLTQMSQTYKVMDSIQGKDKETRQRIVDQLRQTVQQREQEIARLQKQLRSSALRRTNNLDTNENTSAFERVKSHTENAQREHRQLTQLIEENDKLRARMATLEAQIGTSHALDNRDRREAEARFDTLRAEHNRLLEFERQRHEEELKRLKILYTQEHSTSKLAELQAKVDTQEVVIRHLKEQLAANALDSKALSSSQAAEREARSEAEHLREELAQAKAQFTPEMQRLDQLRCKIILLEEKERKREKLLEEYIEKRIEQTRQEAAVEVTKWQRIVDSKNQKWDQMRVELDIILEALEEMQRRGLVLPIPLQKNASEMREHLRSRT